MLMRFDVRGGTDQEIADTAREVITGFFAEPDGSETFTIVDCERDSTRNLDGREITSTWTATVVAGPWEELRLACDVE